MTIALWCVLAGGLMPLIWTATAKFTGDRKLTPRDNKNPRAFLAGATGRQARANNAQLNAFEAFPLFAAAVLTAEWLDATQSIVDGLALTWVGLRLAYGFIYLADWGPLRSLVWFAALLCPVALFIVAA
ncbi:MAG: MAPEG family protein [Abyssibacter sp.]|uniref:MAPEG family protein n=1 Tax=Abyssibacter sp. TaxID=2320200 RepID=UPI002EC49A31|nr:MAPEG family protein [Pseudomonadota bacterium]